LGAAASGTSFMQTAIFIGREHIGPFPAASRFTSC
jgi:hypothetical protein